MSQPEELRLRREERRLSTARSWKASCLANRAGPRHFVKLLDNSTTQVAAQTMGIAQGVFDVAEKHADEKTSSYLGFVELQAIGHKYVDVAMKIKAAKAFIYGAAWHYDHGAFDSGFGEHGKDVHRTGHREDH